MKKIVFTVTNDLAYDQRMNRICQSLSGSGFDVLLVGRKKRSSIELEVKNFAQYRIKCLFEKGKLFYLEYNIRLFFFLLFKNFDIVCGIDLDTILPGLAVTKLKGTTLAYDAHEYFTEVPEVINRPFIKKIWTWVEALSIPQTDIRYTVSESIAEEFKKKYSFDFEVIRNLPVLDVQVKEIPREKFIIYQGALNEGRGLEQLIRASKDLPLKVLLAGEGDLSQPLRELAREEGVEDKIQFMGYVKPSELKLITRKAFIGYNLLEVKSKSYYYSLSNKFFDYIHAGIPNLSNPFPEYKKLNDLYHVSLLTFLSEDAIIYNVRLLFENKKLYDQLVKNCFEARQELNWQREEQKIIRLFKNYYGLD